MASFSFNFDVTSAQNLADGESGIIGQSGSLFVQGAPAITGTGNNSVFVLGSVYSTSEETITHTGSFLSLTVADTGFIGSAGLAAVRASVTTGVILSNSGEIRSDSSAIELGGTSNDMIFAVENSGTISGGFAGLVIYAPPPGNGFARVVNTGEISGFFLALATPGAIGASIYNYGTLSCPRTAVLLGSRSDYLLNEGLIISPAASLLGGGNDFYDGRLGSLVGNGLSLGSLAGGSGSDRLFGGAKSEMFSGQSGADQLRGFGGDDQLFGNAGTDTIAGGDGNDTISGGTGRDVLTGNAGSDAFRFDAALSVASNVDTVMDLAGADTLQLSRAVFSALGSAVTSGEFRAGTTVGNSVAADSNDRLIYNKTTGELFYDADAAGGAAKVKFAVLTGSPNNLAFDDFVMV